MNITKQNGFTMMEAIVSTTLGVWLLLGLTTIFISNKSMDRFTNGNARLQENARFAMEMIIKDIRMAGYVGCVTTIQSVNSTVRGGANLAELWNFDNPIEGSESASNWYPSGSTQGVSDMLAGSDGITIKYVRNSDIWIRDPMPVASAELKVTSVGNLIETELVAITDCESVDIFQITEVQDGSQAIQHNPGGSISPGNSTNRLSKAYDTDARIVRLTTKRYYIGTNPTSGLNGLYVYGPDEKDIDGDGNRLELLSQELIEGIDNMQILFGEDTLNDDNVPDVYVDADNVSNWDDVIGVKLSFIANTVKEDFSTKRDKKIYSLLGNAVDPNDKFLRRKVFTTTTLLRNRQTYRPL